MESLLSILVGVAGRDIGIKKRERFAKREVRPEPARYQIFAATSMQRQIIIGPQQKNVALLEARVHPPFFLRASLICSFATIKPQKFDSELVVFVKKELPILCRERFPLPPESWEAVFWPRPLGMRASCAAPLAQKA